MLETYKIQIEELYEHYKQKKTLLKSQKKDYEITLNQMKNNNLFVGADTLNQKEQEVEQFRSDNEKLIIEVAMLRELV